jgi:ribulose-5-phosphate 4-epimerase/fuculose-1-phosphate aldolase
MSDVKTTGLNQAVADADPELVDDLVMANRILFQQGVVDGFGHVSARHDKHPDRFLIARSMAPALVTKADIMAFDFDGNPLGGDSRNGYLERYLHGAIFRARPDVMGVVHSHSPAVIPYGLVKEVPLRATSHMGGFLGTGVPIYEIRDSAGPASDMLIRNTNLARDLATALADNVVVLMRGHGSTVAGTSVKQAVFRAVYTEFTARLQSDALRLGQPNYLTAEEAVNAAKTNDANIGRAWELWRMAVTGQLG